MGVQILPKMLFTQAAFSLAEHKHGDVILKINWNSSLAIRRSSYIKKYDICEALVHLQKCVYPTGAWRIVLTYTGKQTLD